MVLVEGGDGERLRKSGRLGVFLHRATRFLAGLLGRRARNDLRCGGCSRRKDRIHSASAGSTARAICFGMSGRLELKQPSRRGQPLQAEVSVRLEEGGNIATGQSADTDTVVASTKAYVHALNRLLVRRGKLGEDQKEISYKDVG